MLKICFLKVFPCSIDLLLSQGILSKSAQFVCFSSVGKKCMWGMCRSNVACSRCHNISLETVTSVTLSINQHQWTHAAKFHMSRSDLIVLASLIYPIHVGLSIASRFHRLLKIPLNTRIFFVVKSIWHFPDLRGCVQFFSAMPFAACWVADNNNIACPVLANYSQHCSLGINCQLE